jgi:uncharacterized protein
MMELLVQHGLSVTTVDDNGNTLLILAVVTRHTAAAEWLIQQGVAVNAVRSDGCTALHMAILDGRGDVDIVKLLLANGADVNSRSANSRTALDMTAMKGLVEVTETLIAAGADVNAADSSGITSLHMAISEQHSAVVQLLLKHGAAAVMNTALRGRCMYDAQCCTGMTALMLCSTVDTVKVLLAASADVHVTNDIGDTCLHLAARHSYKVPVVCLLIKAGVDLHAVNNKGRTAAQLAHDNGNTLLEQLLNRAAQQGH